MIKLIFLLRTLFIIRLQPVFIVSILIMVRFLYSYIIYIIGGRYWFRYVLLIVILRGVLVVFTYIITLVPNENFEVYNLVMIFIFMIFIILVYSYDYEIDIRLITLNLWVRCLGIFRLFVISFLLGVIILVVKLRYLNDGSFRVG